MKQLSSNDDLQQYLKWLCRVLEERQATKLSAAVIHASLISPYMSTEFLGESRIALKRVMKEERGVLTDQERDELRDLLIQIEAAFDRKKRHDS